MYLAIFSLVAILVSHHVFSYGDLRDKLAFGLIVCQFGLENVFLHNQLATGIIFMLFVFCFVGFSVKDTGVYLGVISGVLAIISVLAHFGMIDSRTGQGMDWGNYHHLSTMGLYAQLGIIWGMTSNGYDRFLR